MSEVEIKDIRSLPLLTLMREMTLLSSFKKSNDQAGVL